MNHWDFPFYSGKIKNINVILGNRPIPIKSHEYTYARLHRFSNKGVT